MKEDKLDKEIAASLKKKLVEASVPYEIGAWEGFQKKRALQKRKTIAYWASGIAASLLLLAVGINAVDFSVNETGDHKEVQLANSKEQAPEISVEEITTNDAEALAETLSAETSIEPESETSVPASKSGNEPVVGNDSSKASVESKALASTPSATDQPVKKPEVLDLPEPTKPRESEIDPVDTKALATVPQQVEKPGKSEKPKVTSETPVIFNENAVAQTTEKPSAQKSPLTSKAEESEKQVKIPVETLTLAQAEEPVQPTEEKKFVPENEFPIIPKDKTTVGLGMGLSPGFGTVQSDHQVATASTIGLGMLVDINLPGKFTLGSGLGLNYLSQNAEQESTMMAFGNSYPQTEKLEVRQMQVEMPVFVKYPLTRNNSVSVQAGFSNYYALNQTANQENTVERQSAFYAIDALGSSSVSFRQESVTESTSLEPNNGKFYPFATLNFGLNLRVLETKGANYVIMPFYNYQLKQISGYGDTYGLFGASFKMNFGGK